MTLLSVVCAADCSRLRDQLHKSFQEKCPPKYGHFGGVGKLLATISYCGLLWAIMGGESNWR
jgi:hypothetical protein